MCRWYDLIYRKSFLKKSIKIELINELGEVTGHKNHIKKSTVFLHNNSKQTEMILRKQWYLQHQNNKISGNKFNKTSKSIHSENCKTFFKKMKDPSQ